MKKIFLSTISFLMIVFFTGASVNTATDIMPVFDSNISQASSQKEQNIHKEFKVNSGQLLDLDLRSGASINIEGWDKELVSIDVELKGRDWEDISLNFDENTNGVSVTSEYDGRDRNRNAKVSFTIKVPKKFNLKFETMGGGVKLKNVEGEMNGTTMGGALKLANLKGNLSLKTMGGNIELTDSDVDGKVSTMGGTVDIINVTGNVDGKSMGGKVTVKNLKRRDGTTIGKEVNISTMGGSIDVDTAPNGADVHTMGGSIKINSANKFVKAKTMGGDIIIKTIDGSVTATTMGGDIEVTETGTGSNKDIELKSMSGDITLVVPPGFPMNVEAKIVYDEDDRGDYKIYSDFNLSESTQTKSNGSRRHKSEILTGTGSFNGGQNTVTISTVVGNIYIKKGK